MTRKKGDRAGVTAKKKTGMASSLRPKKRPMTSSLRPKLRPVDDGGAVARGNRAAMREATDAATLTMPEGQNMKAGGMAKKGFKAGGKMKKGYKAGGKLEMVKNKQGNTVPFYAADGKGKMKAGGKVKKGYAAGGKTKGAAKGGKVRGAGIARKGVRPAKML
tara:strand:+ start:10919 stop:11404 length:486 start_codon:yes stop_codon:yes gene_type:complete